MMRQDQYEKLQTLSERLTDVFLDEAEPEKWPGHNIDPGAMDQQTRGDRYWCKKNAVATLTLIGRVEGLTDMIRKQSNGAAVVADEEATLDAEINAAEKEAAKLLDQLQRRSKKAEFDKRVHGKS
jgi:hypothetical protein